MPSSADRRKRRVALAAAGVVALLWVPQVFAAEVIVLEGFDDMKAWLESENWWGEVNRERQLVAPNALITGITNRWRETANALPVSDKKEAFYRLLLPLVLHANDLVLKRRAEVETAAAQLSRDGRLDGDKLAMLKQAAVLLRIRSPAEADRLSASVPELQSVIEEALYKLDVVPAGLALGQAAYESGYGTSRFAVEGNALFGQWTFGSEGLRPEQQRAELGDHRIAAFDWPFDSVRSYFINLMSHPAYEPFRQLRAQLRERGEPLKSMVLADGLRAYSERGQAYVDILKSIIRVNALEAADNAVLRDEPRRFLVGAENQADARQLRAEIEEARRSGELAEIIDRMRLE